MIPERPDAGELRYEDLVQEARAAIPSYSSVWTDHNPSDPGITILELLAWVTETVLYRLEKVPEESYQAFLELLEDKDKSGENGHKTLDESIREGLLAYRRRFRAVSCESFEHLVHTYYDDKGMHRPRVLCVAGRDLTTGTNAPGQVSVVLVPERPAPGPGTLEDLQRYIDDRCLLTTRCHVVGPIYVDIHLSATLYLEWGADSHKVKENALEALQTYFDPFRGGPDGRGWPFGRGVHASDVLRALRNIPGLAFAGTPDERFGPSTDGAVPGVTLTSKRSPTNGGIPLEPYELPRLITGTLSTREAPP